jgi:hypothetical protein
LLKGLNKCLFFSFSDETKHGASKTFAATTTHSLTHLKIVSYIPWVPSVECYLCITILLIWRVLSEFNCRDKKTNVIYFCVVICHILCAFLALSAWSKCVIGRSYCVSPSVCMFHHQN